ncbi:hypothetical protein FB446DRAFT_705476 [Lentinula raphanica]|nr:hypothetical protein FB446DRAFT_705476 [Lentinula raphanica]
MSLSSSEPQGIYGPLRMSPDLYSSSSSRPQYTSSPNEGLPNPYEAPPLHDTNSLHATQTNSPQQALQKFNTALQENGQSVIDESRMLDRDVAPALFVAEGIRTMDTHPHHKQSIEIIKKIALGGATYFKQADAALDQLIQFTASWVYTYVGPRSPVWTEGKEIAQTFFEPAKVVVQLFDVLASQLPVINVTLFIITAKTVFKVGKDPFLLGCLGSDLPIFRKIFKVFLQAKFWYTLCDSEVQVVFKVESKTYQNFHELFKKVGDKMEEYGIFWNLYHKHGYVVHVMKSGSYKIQITDFIRDFANFQYQLQQLLTQASALAITNVDKKTDELNQKLDMVIAAIKSLTPKEARVQAKIQEAGGEEKAFQIIETEFGKKITPQMKTILREDLSKLFSKCNSVRPRRNSSTRWNEILTSFFRRSTTVRYKPLQLDSGPHELIHNEDVQQIWKGFAGLSRVISWTQTGEPHEDQWTLKFTGRIIFQPTIGDAIDSDASGYVSIDEINRFTAHCPEDWSLPVSLAHAAAGWYQGALEMPYRRYNALPNACFLRTTSTCVRISSTVVYLKYGA